MNYYLTKEEVHNLNKSYKQYIDIFATGKPYTTGALIYSRIKEVKNNTFYLEVFISKEWRYTPKETTYMFVNNWLYTTNKLKKCTKYEVTVFNGKSLGFTLLTHNGFEDFIEFIAKSFNHSEYDKVFSQSNKITPLESLKNILLNHNSFSINTTIYKLLVNSDLQYYKINYNSFLRVFTYNETDYYNSSIIGLPTVLKIEVAENKFIEFPRLNYFKTSDQFQYAIMTFKRTKRNYSTNETSNIQVMKFDSIKVILFDRFNKTKLITKANKLS